MGGKPGNPYTLKVKQIFFLTVGPMSDMAIVAGMEEWPSSMAPTYRDFSSYCHCWIPNLLSTETNTELPLCYYLLQGPATTWCKLTALHLFYYGRSSNPCWQNSTHILAWVNFSSQASLQPAPLFKDLPNVWATDIGSHITLFHIRGFTL